MSKFKIGDKVQAKGRNGIWEIVETNSGTLHNEYLCYQKGCDGHYGNFGSIKSKNTGIGYDTKEYWFFWEEMLTLYQYKFPEIRITTDGKTTTAQKILNGEILKEASVTLYYKDIFNFNVGCEEVLKKLNTVPHLKWSFKHDNLGEIGELTEQTAIFGEKLYVGDIVGIFDTETGKIFEPRILCKNSDTFVMGFGGRKFINGISGKYQLRKIKSYKDLQNGEIIDCVEVVK